MSIPGEPGPAGSVRSTPLAGQLLVGTFAEVSRGISPTFPVPQSVTHFGGAKQMVSLIRKIY